MINLFPTPIGSFKLNRALNDAELAFIINQDKTPNEGNTTSANTTVLECPELSELSEFIHTCVDAYFDEVYRPLYDVKLRITQSWLNYSEPGQYHHKHNHGSSIVSGCFYPHAEEGVDKIYFYKDGYQMLPITPRDYNVYNSSSWWIPVATGDLILFPSSLTHMVERVVAQETRISLSFNTFPVGYVGDDKKLTGLHL